jgi:hypothetical protein
VDILQLSVTAYICSCFDLTAENFGFHLPISIEFPTTVFELRAIAALRLRLDS